MAGPCSVESREQLFTAAEMVRRLAPRSARGSIQTAQSPYTFQGLGLEALKLLREAGDRYGMMVISEVMEISQIEVMLPYIDIFQVGARNMQNFNLLREVGKVRKPVLLKRGIAATIEEMLLSAEYIMSGGNYQVIFCERGIRTFETYTRNTLDISAIPSCTSCRTCRSRPILRTVRDCATKSRPWLAPRSRRGGCAADRGASLA